MSSKTPISEAVSRVVGDINIISLHDAHFGHDNTTTLEIILAWENAMPDSSPIWKTLDYFFIPGDLFDRLLHLPNHGVPLIRMELRRWLGLAQHYGFGIFVLEGTPSHDWKQSKMIESVAEEMGYTGELQYVDRLSVQYTRKGHSLLYVPDEWRANTQDTYLETLELLAAHGLQQVDFCLFHGQFEYQFPELSLPCHNSDDWQKLVRHYLFAGHIHKPSQHGKILVAGSFDRLRHNEEHPKGFLRVTVKAEGDDVIEFIENHDAKIYNTVPVEHLEVDRIYSHMVEYAEQYPVGSFIRLSGQRAQGLKGIAKQLEKDYPQYRWSILTESSATLAKLDKQKLEAQEHTKVRLTHANLTNPVILEEIEKRIHQRGLASDVVEKALKLAREALCQES